MWSSPTLILLLGTAILFAVAQTNAISASDYSDCDSNLGTLERALYETETNLFELNKIFYPPSLLPTRFIRVEYTFFDENDNDDCKVTYIWAIGEVLFLQPPTLFKYNSLYFYFPNNKLTKLSLRLPIECIPLINGTDGECSCINDSDMLDVLTQQLNIYAKFTNQENIERSNSFARAICAGELYDEYYSGKNIEFTYIIAASAIAGPLLLAMLTFFFLAASCKRKYNKLSDKKQDNKNGMNLKTKRKNLVAFVLIGIYISFYILILDVIAAHTASTSSHEYEPELSVQSRHRAFNLAVAYVTLTCDLLVCSLIILILVIIWGIKLWPNKFNKCFARNCCAKKCCHKSYTTDGAEIPDVADQVINSLLFPSLLIPPFLSITSHLGYIILAWITQPSRSTTTLILYYFILFYLYLIFRTSYKHGSKILKSKSDSKTINVLIFTINLLLGMFYLGIAVVFIVIVYIEPLASEDLFSYLFNVVQFMIVVVSTQYFYKLIAGKSFSIKKTIKTVHKIISGKNYKLYKPLEEENLDKKTGGLFAALIDQHLATEEVENQHNTTEEVEIQHNTSIQKTE